MGYRLLGASTMLVHFAFLAYVVAGGFIAWVWPRTFWAHLAAVGWGFSSVVFGLQCPLTALENWARHRAGEAPLPRGFIDTYITGVVYPERAKYVVTWLVAGIVLVSWVGLGLRAMSARSAGAS